MAGITDIFTNIKNAIINALEDAGAKAGNDLLKDLTIQGSPVITIKGADLLISSEGNINVIDNDRGKTLVAFPLPINLKITIPDISIPIKIDSQLEK